MNNRQHPLALIGQGGAATLLVVLLLLLGMTVIVVTASRTGMVEQQITGNDIRAREAQEAAEAGLEYAISWANKNDIDIDVGTTMTCPGDAACPSLVNVPDMTPDADGKLPTSSGETYAISSLTFTKGDRFIKVTAIAQGDNDNSITAKSEAYLQQTPKQLWKPGTVSPPPWVTAGCITEIKGNPHMILLSSTSIAVSKGSASSNASCLPIGHLNVHTWTDDPDNPNGVYDAGEENPQDDTLYDDNNKLQFQDGPCDPLDAHCAWKQYFQMSINDAKQEAIDAGHEYPGSIPCGAPSSPPSIYVITNGGPINKGDIKGSCSGIIGTLDNPVLLIIDSSAGCPKFNGGITIYGIVYFETTSACNTNGWGGADIYGSIFWEGGAMKINSASSHIIEVNYGNSGSNLDKKFHLGLDSATRIPGTWKDF